VQTLHFDARFIRIGHHDGISRFSAELVKALSKKLDVVVLIYDLRQLDPLPNGIKYLVVNNPQAPSEIFIARKLNKIGVTHVFSPMQVMGTVGRKYKLVLTLHDLIYYRHRKPPQDLNILVRSLWRLYHLSYEPQRWLLNRADAVATVSEATKKLIARHKLTKRPVTVVYNAPDKSQNGRARRAPTGKKLLYIGSFMPYKNVETLILATGLLEGYELHLLSKITSDRKSQLEGMAKRAGAKVVFHNGVTDEQYVQLLDDAFALVTASKDEGFGIPLVEAMQRGTPVVVSNLEIFHEVASNAGSYFDPNTPADLAACIKKLTIGSNWADASKASVAQAARFDWDASADQLLKAFDGLESK
jgi:glycosyltransferase involved in cell wall biosynthesis